MDAAGAIKPWVSAGRPSCRGASGCRLRETRRVTTEAECRRAPSLIGEAITAVTYVGLTYDDPSTVEWDVGDWHWLVYFYRGA